MKTLRTLRRDFKFPEGSIRIPNGKNAAEIITRNLINMNLIYFDGLSPYIKLTTHFHHIDAEETLTAFIRSLIHSDNRYKVSVKDIKESIARIRDCMDLQIDFDNYFYKNQYLINLKNGVYDIKQQKLLDHSIGYYFDYCLPFSYIPNEKRMLDTYRYFAESSLGNENEKSVRIAIGYALSSLTNVKKAVVIIGPKNSAKSKILDLIERGTGQEYVKNNAFDKLGSERAIASYTGGIRVNLSRDVKIGLIKEDDGFKSVISCETINGRLLYKNEISVTPKVTCIAASNCFPQFKHADDASLDRIIAIKIQGYQGKIDPEFPDKLFAELDSICSHAIDSLKEFIASGYDFKLSKESITLMEHERAKLHTSEAFLNENYDFNNDSYVSSVELYRHYTDWCRDNAFEPVGKNTFYDTIKVNNPNITYKKVPHGTGYVNGFYGVSRKCNYSNVLNDNSNKISECHDSELKEEI